VRVELPYPVYPRSALLPHGRDYSLLVGLQTGVHTFAVATYDAAGKLLWEDRSGGAYPNAAAAADVDGDALDETVADDHGALRVWASDGTLRATHPGWPPAYNLPIVGPFGAAGAPAIFRSSGINGLALLDPATQVHWFREAPIWRHYGCLGAVGDTRGDGAWKYASCAEDGVLECLEVATGAPAWSVDLKTATPPSSVIAADLDGDGGDEFLTGLADGRLVCVKEGQIAWEVQLDAAVANPIVADLDGDGLAEIVVSTSDGCVRVLR
jgi:outer membrane protein assembly factor BamB